MIIFDRVTHYLRMQDPPIVDRVSFRLPKDRRVAIFGLRGSGRTTLMHLISGQISQPKRGVISRGDLTISFPLGPQIAVVPRNTVIQNLLDISRIYGFPFRSMLDFIVEHGDAEKLLQRRTNTLIGSERSRVFCPISYLLPFDYYIIDGDPFGSARYFREHFEQLFARRVEGSGLAYMNNNVGYARRYCDMGAIFFNRKVVIYDDIEEAIDFYWRVLKPIEDSMSPKEIDKEDLGEMARLEAERQEAVRRGDISSDTDKPRLIEPVAPPPGGVFL